MQILDSDQVLFAINFVHGLGAAHGSTRWLNGYLVGEDGLGQVNGVIFWLGFLNFTQIQWRFFDFETISWTRSGFYIVEGLSLRSDQRFSSFHLENEILEQNGKDGNWYESTLSRDQSSPRRRHFGLARDSLQGFPNLCHFRNFRRHRAGRLIGGQSSLEFHNPELPAHGSSLDIEHVQGITSVSTFPGYVENVHH